MMVRLPHLLVLVAVLGLAATACQSQEAPVGTFDRAAIQFSGERALETESQFVSQFPNRHSGQPNNQAAADWILQRFMQVGWDCQLDRWEVVNYSRPVELNNVACRLPGDSPNEILVTAHLDQAPTTVQGADNDGSGIAILLQLAGIFASEPSRPYTLAFVATDAEEYGMLGTERYLATHPDPRQILAGISLDNLGRSYYDAMKTELLGRFRGYGPIWIALAARDAAKTAGADWVVLLRAPFDQVTDQAAPVSLMDQGPMVAAGIPALGFAGHTPSGLSELEYELYHAPGDTLEHQSAGALGQSGLIAEALIRQLMSLKTFPRESGPYLYFDATGQVLRGPALWLIFAAFVGVFFLGSLLVGRRPLSETVHGWRRAFPHFLGLWLPLLGSIVLLYLFVLLGLMDTYARYPATTKDPLLIYPRWPAVILFVIGLAAFIYLGRRLDSPRPDPLTSPSGVDTKSLSLLVIGLCGLYILVSNPFSLLFMLPVLFWFLIRHRTGAGRGLNLVWFALGGLVVYALLYVFGFLMLRLNWSFLWYLMNMFSTRMISFPAAAVITAILAAGLAMLIPVRRSWAPDVGVIKRAA